MEINWDFIETIAKAIAVIGGMIVSLYQVYARLPKSRMSIIRDLEILKLLDENDPAYITIKDHVNQRIENIYQPSSASQQNIKIHNWNNLIIGVVFLTIFAPWTYSLYNQGSWWALFTGFVAVGGMGNIGMAFDKNLRRPKESTA